MSIVEHPDVRRMLLRMTAQTQAARALAYYAAGQVDRAALGDPQAKDRLELVTPLAKAYGTDLDSEVASLGIQVHGGMGHVAAETGREDLMALAKTCDAIGRLAGASHDDRLAASYPFLTMLSVAACGWLMNRQGRAAGDDTFGQIRKACTRFYLDQVVPEALGLHAAATATSDVLYAMPVAAFTA